MNILNMFQVVLQVSLKTQWLQFKNQTLEEAKLKQWQ